MTNIQVDNAHPNATAIDAVVSGATGLIGRWLVPLLTKRGRTVAVLVRNAIERADEYRLWVAAHGGDPSRVRFFEADLAEPNLGLDDVARDELQTARDFIHLGAAMRFGLSLDEARRVNVEGTRAFIDLAKRATSLRRIVHVGGFRVNDHEDAATELETLGGYERSKIEADMLVRSLATDLPITRVQPGSIIGDATTGESSQLWGFSDLVRDLLHGKIPAIVGGPGYWMPMISVDYVAAFIAGLVELEHPARSYTLLDDATPDLDEVFERIARHLGIPAVRRVVPKGALAWFLRSGGERLTGVSGEALSFIDRDRYDIDATLRASRQMDLPLPNIETAILRTVDYFVATRFGKSPTLAGGGMKRIAGIPTFIAGAKPSECQALFLHGIPLDASSWDGVFDRLPRSLRAARVDIPGLGRTTKTADSPATWMESLLAGAGHPKQKPWLIGHSLGTRFAVEHAARHRDRVGGLVLISPFFLQSPPPVFLRSAAIGKLAFSLMRDADLVKLVGERFVDAPREWLSRPKARARIAVALAEAHAVRDALGEQLRTLAKDLPVTILAGERDPIVEAPVAHAETIIIPDTGHFPQLDAAPAVVFAITRAMSRATKRDAAKERAPQPISRRQARLLQSPEPLTALSSR